MYEIKRAKRVSQALVHLVIDEQVCSRTIKHRVYQYGPNTGISEQSVSKLLTIFHKIPFLLP